MIRVPRVGLNIAAQSYSQFITLVVQLCTIPFLIKAWGLNTYGVWLALTALPTYLALSDFGFTFVAKNDMAIQTAKGDRIAALETYHSVFSLLLVVVGGITVVAVALVSFLPVGELLKLGPVSLSSARGVLLVQISGVLLYQFFLLLSSGVRCAGRPAMESTISATARLAEALALVASAACGGSLVVSAVAALSARAISVGCLYIYVGKIAPWLRIGFSAASRRKLRLLLAPSTAYMLIPLSNALLIQGPIVVLGSVSSPAIVAVFSTCRTITRLGMAGANMLNFALTPEYSVSFGRDDADAHKRTARLHAVLLVLGLLIYLCVVWMYGTLGVRLLSHGRISAPVHLLIIMGLGVAFEMVWSSMLTPVAARNAHSSIALRLAVISVAGLAFASLHPTVEHFAIVVSVVHGLMILVVSWRWVLRLISGGRKEQSVIA